MTAEQWAADQVIAEAHRLQNLHACSFGEALRLACDGDRSLIIRTIHTVLFTAIGAQKRTA